MAMFKTGDTLFALKYFAGARRGYQAVLDRFAGCPRWPGRWATARSKIAGEPGIEGHGGADPAMRHMLAKFPASELADNGLLLLGEGFSESGASTDALKIYGDFAVLFPGRR